MWTTVLLIGSVLGTSIVSGVFGMAGGMILMAILVSSMSVAGAMMIHGAVQATSNGSRAWFLRRHIRWRIMPAYVAGAAVAVAAFMALALVPDSGVVLILVGMFPLLARATPRLRGLDVNHLPTAVLCGTIVTSAQLIAGASGSLLDVFYLNSRLNRHEIVASKAVTQTLGHLLKLGYYGAFIGVAEDIPTWFYATAMTAAIVGTRLGTRLLDTLKDDTFRRISGWVILFIAAVCVVKGTMALIHG